MSDSVLTTSPEEYDPAIAVAPREDHAANVKQSLARNVAVDAVSRIAYMLLRFFVPPFVLAHVTLEAYGLWSTAFILVSYIGVSTLGISNVYVKYVAEYSARRQYKEANSLISTGLAISLPVCTLLFVIIWLGWPLLARWFQIRPALQGDAKEVILSVVALFLVSMSLGAFRDMLAGVQKIALIQYLWTVGWLAETALIFILVGSGRGIRGMSEAYVVRTIIEVGLSIPVAFKVLPWLRLSLRRCSRHAFHILVKFGSVVQLQSLLAIFLDSVERAIAAPLIGLAATGLLDISQKLPTMAAAVPTTFASAFLPAASYLHGGLEGAPEQRESIRKLYIKGARYMNVSAGYVCAFLALLPGPLFQVWMGKHFDGAIYLLIVFAVATQVHLLTGPGTSILRGIGRTNEEFYYGVPNILFLCLTVPLSYLVLGRWTAVGIGTAVPLATLLASLVFTRRANRLLGVSLAEYLRRVIGPGFIPYLLAALFTVPVVYACNHSSRWAGAVWIVLAGILYSLLTVFVIDRFVWDKGERAWFHAIIGQKLSQLRRRA